MGAGGRRAGPGGPLVWHAFHTNTCGNAETSDEPPPRAAHVPAPVYVQANKMEDVRARSVVCVVSGQESGQRTHARITSLT